MKILFTLIFLPFIALGQNKLDFNKLIEETNHSLKQYSQLSSYIVYYSPLSSFGLSKNEIKELIMEADRPDLFVLSKDKDSIENFHMINYFKEKIIGQIDQIVRHPDFLKYDIRKLITSGELEMEITEDNKLFNFSFAAKDGGMCNKQINLTYYINFTKKNSSQVLKSDSFFDSDGHNKIYTLKTSEGTKYVLIEHAYCYQNVVRLISFKGNNFKEEFGYNLQCESFYNDVSYNQDTKTIVVDYDIEGCKFCPCPEDSYTSINCQCRFIFTGSNFELVEE